jgi:hypothetical protein
LRCSSREPGRRKSASVSEKGFRDIAEARKRFAKRPVPDAKVAIFPFKRIFQTALIDEDLQSGYSTVVCMPGHESQDPECWYINMGTITKQPLDPNRMMFLGDR